MATAKKCDRCGIFYDSYGVDSGEWNSIAFYCLGKNGGVKFEGEALDFCPSCMAAVEKFIKEPQMPQEGGHANDGAGVL